MACCSGLLTLSLCIPLLGLTPGLSIYRPFKAPTTQSCNSRRCLDLAAGVQISNEHIQHVTGIWDLIEALGHPESTTFTPTAQRLGNPDSYPIVVYHDPSREFLRRMIMFAHKTERLDSDLSFYILIPVLRVFRTSGRMLQSMQRMIKTLSELERLAPIDSANPNSNFATDGTLNTTIESLANQTVAACNVIMESIEPRLYLAAETDTYGSDLVVAMGTERVRVTAALKNLPWWDAWTLAHWTGSSDTARFRAYSKFLKEEEPTFRYLADAASVIHDNLVDLRDYCTWYSKNDTMHLIHGGDHLAGTNIVSVQSISRKLENLVDRVQLTAQAGKNPDNPGWPARRVRSRTTPWLS
ncbi:hypothetical protein C8R46DRAFT_1130175, partial [Mycena filopes]